MVKTKPLGGQSVVEAIRGDNGASIIRFFFSKYPMVLLMSLFLKNFLFLFFIMFRIPFHICNSF
ncbi:hypothetical protein Lalb_Chr18g0048961 [Lupinus albus]|uniref:Uncharacterized protein n=1 Tax=Lupinus albus TaxID=3870 RepID=A0A6A4P5V9_LUPAL|nr:hypothetical protein Lalb_Chr18g0048961 [Lupinus albus]